jgi:predicted nucleic acid-binding protein
VIAVDTSVWVNLLRGGDGRHVRELVALIEEDAGVCLTDVVLSELLQGVRTEREARQLEQRLLAFDVLRLSDLEDFTLAAQLCRTARRGGHTIRRTLDCLIAAVCIREDVPLLHDDVDFDRLAATTPLRVHPVPA